MNCGPPCFDPGRDRNAVVKWEKETEAVLQSGNEKVCSAAGLVSKI